MSSVCACMCRRAGSDYCVVLRVSRVRGQFDLKIAKNKKTGPKLSSTGIPLRLGGSLGWTCTYNVHSYLRVKFVSNGVVPTSLRPSLRRTEEGP